MKTILIKTILIILILSLQAFAINLENPEAEKMIIEYVAVEFDVSEEDVTLYSPDLVVVDKNGDAIVGVAEFIDCGEDCTRVIIEYPDRTLDFQIIEEITGL